MSFSGFWHIHDLSLGGQKELSLVNCSDSFDTSVAHLKGGQVCLSMPPEAFYLRHSTVKWQQRCKSADMA